MIFFKGKCVLILTTNSDFDKYAIGAIVNMLNKNSIKFNILLFNKNTHCEISLNPFIEKIDVEELHVEELSKIIKKRISNLSPDIIITQNPDKSNTRLNSFIYDTIYTIYSSSENKYSILTFDTPSLDNFLNKKDEYNFRPNLFIKISEKDLNIYNNQITDFKELQEHIIKRSQSYGQIISEEYAEGFMLIKSDDDKLINLTIAPDLIKIDNKSLVPYLVSLIENKYDVKSIKVGKFPLWQFIRYRIGLHLWFTKEIKDSSKLNPYFINNSANIVKRIFKGFFKSFNIFSKFNYILFTESSELREYENKVTERLAHNIIKYHNNDILVSLNVIEKRFFDYSNFTFPKYADSIFFYIFSFLFYLKKVKIEDRKIIEDIENEYGFKIGYKKKVNDFFRLARFLNFYFKLKKIRCIYLNCSYSPVLHHAAVYAARLNGIKTVDMQHAMIDHSYYITNDIGKDSFPEYMFVFGDFFKKFVFKNYIKKENVISIGNFFLEYSLIKAKQDKELTNYFNELRKDFKNIICVSMQEVFEELLKIIYKVAKLDEKNCFLIIRRLKKDYVINDKYNNVKETTNLGFHNSIYFCDLHITVNSFCAFEALYFNKTNILVNINNNSKSYYGGLLDENYNTYFVESEYELLDLINKDNLINNSFVAEYFFASSNEEKVKDAILMLNK